MDGVEYTYEEAGKLCGVSSETIRHRLKRGKLKKGRPTNSNRPTVILTPADIAAISVGRPAGGQPGVQPPGHDRPETHNDNDMTGRLMAMEERAKQAERERDEAREREDRMREERDAERARGDRAERNREEVRITAAVAQAEADGLREALAEARKPFWRRWIGGG